MASTRTAQTRYNPNRNSRGQLGARPNSGVNSTDARLAQGDTIRNFKGDTKSATRAQNAEAGAARSSRSRSQQAYDIKRAFGVSVG